MPRSFTVPIATVRPVEVPSADLHGEDVAFAAEIELAPNGGWQTLRGVPAARQSVIREAAASPGAFARRPDWGWGMVDAVKRPATAATRDDLVARARRRLAANPRVTRVRDVSIIALDTADGLRLDVQVESGGRDARIESVIRAGGTS